MEAIVLVSGGQDSATCLAQACQTHGNAITAIAFDYNQRHRIELDQAKELAHAAKVPLEVIPLPFISELSQNALTSTTIPIEHIPGQLPSTFVDGRNLFFLSVAAVRAKQLGASIIYTGVCQTDYSGYPDCRDDFITSLQQTITLGLGYGIDIRTPLMFLTKAETVQLMQSLNRLEWYEYTHTCYEGKRPACGKCPSCKLRLKGFQEAGIPDPIAYE